MAGLGLAVSVWGRSGSFVGYLGPALVFVWDGVLRRGFITVFWGFFLVLAGFSALGGWALGNNSMGI